MRKVNYLRTLLATTAVSLALVGCSDSDNEVNQGSGTDVDAAYIALSVKQATGATRASGEDDGTEGDVSSVYIITFDDNENVLKVPNVNRYYTSTSLASGATDALAVNAGSKTALVVANPNDKLLSVITSLTLGSTFTTLNSAISGIDITELTGANGYTMISTFDDSTLTPGTDPSADASFINDPLVTITKLVKIGDIDSNGTEITNENAAKTEAELTANRTSIKVERLASKIEFKTASTISVPTDDTFTLSGWTTDVLNTTYYPYAAKTLLNTTHNPTTGNFYTYNFYTKDPNYADNEYSELAYKAIGSDFGFVTDWYNASTSQYVVENTMAATSQLYQNATRLIIEGVYTPKDCTENEDWFYYGGKIYASFTDLKTDYTSNTNADLVAACDYMAEWLVRYFKYYSTSADGLTWATATLTYEPSFSNLTTTILDEVTNGGQVLNCFWEGKEADPTGKNLIRWYQKGVSYYYYENRHDNEITADMAFAKYGAVRNNWYTVTLTKVSQQGTPWYPIVDPDPDPVDPDTPDPEGPVKPQPGPEDPDPKDPIDETAGYAAFEIEVGPWITWGHNLEL